MSGRRRQPKRECYWRKTDSFSAGVALSARNEVKHGIGTTGSTHFRSGGVSRKVVCAGRRAGAAGRDGAVGGQDGRNCAQASGGGAARTSLCREMDAE